jgi:hypothetical protein
VNPVPVTVRVTAAAPTGALVGVIAVTTGGVTVCVVVEGDVDEAQPVRRAVEAESTRAESATADKIFIGAELSIKSALKEATEKSLLKIRLIERNSFAEWPDLDALFGNQPYPCVGGISYSETFKVHQLSRLAQQPASIL